MLSIADQYHRWYYDEKVWTTTTFLGVSCLKSVSDMWNYQEILFEYRPSLIVEFGTHAGGSALFFAEMLKLVTPCGLVLTVDIDHSQVEEKVRRHKSIELLQSDTTKPVVAEHVRRLRAQYPGRTFFIVDSDHHEAHVFQELLQIRAIAEPGDYVVVEDGNINGHPVLPEYGPGPYEALEAYFVRYPEDYEIDQARADKFGFTFAPKGFLVRR